MEQLDQSLSTLINKLQAAGFEQAPEVIAGTIRAIYWDGVVQLGAVIFLLTTLLIAIMVTIAGSIKKNESMVALGVITTIITFVISMPLNIASNPWLKVFDPQAAFYQQIMKGIL